MMSDVRMPDFRMSDLTICQFAGDKYLPVLQVNNRTKEISHFLSHQPFFLASHHESVLRKRVGGRQQGV